MSRHDASAPYREPDGSLAVGGVSIDRLAERVGSTPFFAYDRALLSSRVEMLRGLLPSAIHLSYAIKANPMPAVVQHMSGLVDSLDVASAGEMQVALDTPTPPERVTFAGPGKTTAELTRAVAAGVTIEIESPTEAVRITEVAERLGVRPRVAVRVNPDFQVKGSGMRMGGGSQQFGIDAEDVPAVLRDLIARDLDPLGFHVFPGSQNLNAAILCEAQRNTVELAQRLAADLRAPLRYLNLGGGFGIPYFDKDVPLDIEAIATNLHELAAGPIAGAFPEARVVIELGRYLVGEAGVYVTRVVDRKVSRGKTFVVVDGGLHHQLAASGNFGQVIRRNYPIAVAGAAGREVEPATVVGCLCTPLDLLGDNVDLPRAEVGDLLVLFQAGAYGLTASPTAFLGHPMPAEVLV